MGNEHKRRCTNGDEVMVHTSERHLVVMGRGESAAVKRATNKRERREGAVDVDAILAEQSDDVRDAGADRWGGANWEGCGGECCDGQTGPLR